MTITIQPFDESYSKDVLQAIAVLKEYEHELCRTRVSSTVEICNEYFVAIKADCQQKQGEILVALVNEQFAGFVAYHYESSDMLYEIQSAFALVNAICVLPAFRHLSIGQYLLQSVEHKVKSARLAEHVRIWSLANNQLAIKAYTRFGFSPFEMVFDKTIDRTNNKDNVYDVYEKITSWFDEHRVHLHKGTYHRFMAILIPFKTQIKTYAIK